MAFGSFVAGHLVPVAFQQTGGQVLSLNVKEHSLDLSVLLHDVTGVKSLGVRARISGPLDANGRVILDLDLLEAWFTSSVANVPRILPGYSGVMLFGVNAAGTGIQIPMICEQLHHSGSTEKELMWDATWKCNSLAGVFVYPNL